MRQVFKINEQGFYMEPVILKESESIPADCVEKFPPNFYKQKWNGLEWEEGLSQEEIDAIENIQANPPKTELELLQETVDQLVLDNLMRGL